MNLLREIKTSVLLTVVLALLLCGAYPVVVWAAAEGLFPGQANGSLITDPDGTVRGSALLAQNFASAKYFHPRSSAAGTAYDAASSGGTNFGPTSKKLADSIQAAVAAYRSENSLDAGAPVPADAVTSSASGLDPHISLANAALQAPRVAAARHLPVSQVRRMIADRVSGPDLGILGVAGVNVLLLNLDLDRLPRTSSLP